MRIQRYDGIEHIDGAPAGLGGDWGFWDGSASRHPVEELRRAAWAVAFLDAEGNKQALISGPVWQHLPQTPQASEHVGAVAAIQVLSKPTVLIGDCLGVVNTINKCKLELLPKGAYAGVVSDVADRLHMDNIKECRWVPSHTCLKDDPTHEERITHYGNDLVDVTAGEHRKEIEDDIDPALLRDADAECRKAVAILKALGEVLSGWPSLPKGMERQTEGGRGSLRIRHDWTYAFKIGLWRCRACGRLGHGTPDEGPPRIAGSCQPGRALQREERAQQLGHNLSIASRAGVPITYCSRCAAHGTWRWSKLLDTCPRTPSSFQGQRWLHITKSTGEAPMQLSKGQKARLGTTTRKKARNVLKTKVVKSCSDHRDPLRNKVYADSNDKSNWRPFLRPSKTAPS